MKIDDFTTKVGSVFHIIFSDDHQREATLLEVKPMGQQRKDSRLPFSLLFEIAIEDSYHNQGIYLLKHPLMEDLSLFLVPLGPGEKSNSMVYEAIIN